MLAVTALVDAGGTVTAVTDSGRDDRTCRAIAAVRRGTWRSAERLMVAQNRTLCASAARRVSGLLRHRAVGSVTGLPADGVAGVIGLAGCGCRSGSGDRGDLRPAGAQPSLARIRLMWVSTVRSAMTSRAVVCRLVSPCTMSSAIWRSRRVSGRLRSFSGSRPRGVGLQSAVIRSLRPITRAAGSAGPSSASAWQASSFSQAAQVDGGPVDGNFQRPWKAITDHIPRHSQPRPGASRQLAERRSGLRCELCVRSLA